MQGVEVGDALFCRALTISRFGFFELSVCEDRISVALNALRSVVFKVLIEK